MKRLTVLLTLALFLTSCAPWTIDIGNFHMSGGEQPAKTEAVPTQPVTSTGQGGGNTSDANTGDAKIPPPSYEIKGAPYKVTAYRWADGVFNENVCTLPGGKDFCGKPGVVGVDTKAEQKANPSAALISPDSQESLENATATKFVHEGGYQLTTTAGVVMKFDKYTIIANPQDDTEWHIYLRGRNSGPGDLNLDVNFSRYHPGATTVTQYQVKENAGGFMDQPYIYDQAANSHRSNCGLHGCKVVYVVFFDVNNGAWTILRHTNATGWTLVATNVVAP